jgi:hypothetical protein
VQEWRAPSSGAGAPRWSASAGCASRAAWPHASPPARASRHLPRGARSSRSLLPPPCTARGRPSRLFGVLHLHARGVGTQTPPGSRPRARSHTDRSKQRPRPPPPLNRTLTPPRTRTLQRPCVERWPGLVTVLMPMLSWSVPLWMDDSTPSRQRGIGCAHQRWRWICRQAWLSRVRVSYQHY